MGNHQRRFLHPFHHFGHGIGLTRARGPQQRYILLSGLDCLDQLLDRLRLISRGRIIRDNPKGPAAWRLPSLHHVASSVAEQLLC